MLVCYHVRGKKTQHIKDKINLQYMSWWTEQLTLNFCVMRDVTVARYSWKIGSDGQVCLKCASKDLRLIYALLGFQMTC